MQLSSEKVRILMAKNCLNVKSLSETAHIAQNTLRKALNHGKTVRTDVVGRMAKALGCDPQDIIVSE